MNWSKIEWIICTARLIVKWEVPAGDCLNYAVKVTVKWIDPRSSKRMYNTIFCLLKRLHIKSGVYLQKLKRNPGPGFKSGLGEFWQPSTGILHNCQATTRAVKLWNSPTLLRGKSHQHLKHLRHTVFIWITEKQFIIWMVQLIIWPFTYQIVFFFKYPPSSGIAPCVGTTWKWYRRHTLAMPCLAALGQVFKWLGP